MKRFTCVVFAALTACSSGASDGTAATDMAGAAHDPAADLNPLTYPAGPYAEEGNVNPGDVLPNFAFQGHFSPTATTGRASAQPFGEFTLEMLHRSEARFAILNLTAYWCTPCQVNAGKLVARAADLIPRGVALVNILVEGNTPADIATRANLTTWIGRVRLPYTSVLDSVDPQPPMERFFGVPRDQFVVVDLETMTLIGVFHSDPAGAIEAIEGMLPPGDGGL